MQYLYLILAVFAVLASTSRAAPAAEPDAEAVPAYIEARASNQTRPQPYGAF